jgi:hypothetical protein
MKSYNYLEPRLSVAYQINDDQSIKASYNRMVQYLTDFKYLIAYSAWCLTPSDRFIKPQIADQVALGYFKTLKTICIPWK